LEESFFFIIISRGLCIMTRGVFVHMTNITIEFVFAGIGMFWVRLRLILAARARMSLRGTQDIFMPKNINSITINITLEGIEAIKTEKNNNKTLRRIFFSPAL